MFSQDWTIYLKESIKKSFEKPPNGPITCLEIGSFEGKGSLIIQELLCYHRDSRLYCIDPWEDAYVSNDKRFSEIDHLFIGQYDTFLKNTKDIPNIFPLRGKSDDMIQNIPCEIDFAYIDGDHSPEQVYKDGINVLKKMKSGGVIVFDDYLWEHNGVKCKDGVDRFLNENTHRYDMIHSDYHVIIRIK